LEVVAVVVVVVLNVLLSRYVCSIIGCCCSFNSFVFAFCLFDVWFCETIGEVEKSAKSQTTFWHKGIHQSYQREFIFKLKIELILPLRFRVQVER